MGIFQIIRGFADLRDLAQVSVPYTMTDGDAPLATPGRMRGRNELNGKENSICPGAIFILSHLTKVLARN